MFPFTYTAQDPDPIKLWQHLHGASSHFPIAMLFIACAFDFGSTLFRKPRWRIVSFWMVIGAAIVALPAILSGLTGLNGWFGQDKWMADHMILHRNTSFGVGAGAMILALWRTARRDRAIARHDATTGNHPEVSPMNGAEWAAYLVVLLSVTVLGGYTGLLGAYVARGY